MNSMTNDSTVSSITPYYITCSLSSGFGLISVILCIMIVIIVRRSKPRLHTVRHLLICNTCIASIIYCIVQTINYIILIFLPEITSDIVCRWRAYFGYMSISAVTYSYFVQAISRLLFSGFSTKYPWVTTFKTHYVLILTHWILVIIIPSPSVITKDITFRPGLLCWVPIQFIIHVGYTVFAYYVIPALTIVIIYIWIYKQLKKAKQRAEFIHNTTNGKRDLEVLRNIVVLLSIYIAGGIPTLFFIISAVSIFYYIGIVSFTFSVMVEKTCTFLLDRELRLVVKNIIFSRNRVMPFENSISRGGHPANVGRSQRT